MDPEPSQIVSGSTWQISKGFIFFGSIFWRGSCKEGEDRDVFYAPLCIVCSAPCFNFILINKQHENTFVKKKDL
uniref:Uncharacterized protein n=1 Tax=Romanomermis culicivorax TaxID=13658 RepID=A0A915KQS9_ROMCU